MKGHIQLYKEDLINFILSFIPSVPYLLTLQEKKKDKSDKFNFDNNMLIDILTHHVKFKFDLTKHLNDKGEVDF